LIVTRLPCGIRHFDLISTQTSVCCVGQGDRAADSCDRGGRDQPRTLGSGEEPDRKKHPRPL